MGISIGERNTAFSTGEGFVGVIVWLNLHPGPNYLRPNDPHLGAFIQNGLEIGLGAIQEFLFKLFPISRFNRSRNSCRITLSLRELSTRLSIVE